MIQGRKSPGDRDDPRTLDPSTLFEPYKERSGLTAEQTPPPERPGPGCREPAPPDDPADPLITAYTHELKPTPNPAPGPAPPRTSPSGYSTGNLPSDVPSILHIQLASDGAA